MLSSAAFLSSSLRSSPLAHPSPPPSPSSLHLQLLRRDGRVDARVGVGPPRHGPPFPARRLPRVPGTVRAPSRAGDPVALLLPPRPAVRPHVDPSLPRHFHPPRHHPPRRTHPRERPRDPPRRRRPVPRRRPRVRRDQLHQKRRRRLPTRFRRAMLARRRDHLGVTRRPRLPPHAPSRRDGRPKIIPQRPRLHVLLRAELRVRVRRGPARRVFSTAREGPEVGVGVARGGCVGASRARRRGQHQSHAGLLASSRGCRVGRDHRHLVRGSRVGAETTRLGGERRRRGSATHDKDGDDGFESTRWRPARWVRDGRRPVG